MNKMISAIFSFCLCSTLVYAQNFSPAGGSSLAGGAINQVYAGQVLNFTVPATADINTSIFGDPMVIPGVPTPIPNPNLDLSADITDVTWTVDGLPAGLSAVCNLNPCTYLANASGTITINGTPTEDGTFIVNITSITNGSATMPAPISQTMVFPAGQTGILDEVGYTIEISGTALADFSISSDTVCTGTAIQMNNLSVNAVSYNWSFPGGNPSSSNLLNPTVTYNTPGNYTITLTAFDGNGNTATHTESVTVLQNAVADITANGSNQVCQGTSLLLSTPFNADFTYQWYQNNSLINGANSDTYTAWPSGSTDYSVTVQNTNNCSDSDTVSITLLGNCQGILNLTVDTAIGVFDTLYASVDFNNAVNVYSCFAKLRFRSDLLQLVSSEVGDFLGNTILNSPPQQIGDLLEFGMSKIGQVSGSTGNGNVYKFAFLVLQPVPQSDTLVKFWLQDLDVFNDVGNNVNVNTNGLRQTWIRPVIDVWPGDLDNSGVVDVSDILPIGYFYNQTGPSRPNADLSWTAQRAPLWGFDISFPGATGYRTFADATGDGTINLSEQTAVGLNMAQIQNKTYNYEFPRYSTVPATPAFAVEMPVDTILTSNLPQTITIPVSIGSQADPVTNLYGVSIDLVYDPVYVNENSISIDYGGSFFGISGQDYISIPNAQTGSYSIGMTRFGNQPLNGYGHLFDVILELNQLNANGYFRMDAIRLNASDNIGNQIDVNNHADSIFIDDGTLTGVIQTQELEVSIYPNPFGESTNITVSGPIKEGTMEVYNSLGEIIREMSVSEKANYRLSDLPSGIYFLIIKSEGNPIFAKKLLSVLK